MYRIFVLVVVSFIINDYTVQKHNKSLLFNLKNIIFPKIFSKDLINSKKRFTTNKNNMVTSKKIDLILHKFTVNKFKCYLRLYKLFKKFYIFDSMQFFVLLVYFSKNNIFKNWFYFNHKLKCWFHKRASKMFFFYFFKKLIFFIKFKNIKNKKNFKSKLILKKIKFILIFLKFSKIITFLNNFSKKIFNFKNIFTKINLKYFFLIKQFFLRKTKCFNKSRYSRNRQNFRTGFYWCIYVNIVALVGLNFLFYKFIVNFTALWYFFFFFIFIFFFSKFFKYNYINFYNVYAEILNIYSFFFNLFNINFNIKLINDSIFF